MSDIFLSEIDGGSFAPTGALDLTTDNGLQSIAYCLLFGGTSPLGILQGEDATASDFEESLNAKVTIRSMERMESTGTAQLRRMVDQRLVKLAKIKVKNTGLERVNIYVHFITLDGSPVSDTIAVFENGVMAV
jgi:hypothetical protein